MEDDIRQEVAALRLVMTELRPPALDEWGLPAALTDYATAFQRQAGVACTVKADLPVRLTPAQETVLYRIAQEALANVAKHARAGHVWVTLDAAGDQVRLEVRDDGTGFVTTRSVDPLGGQLGLNHFGLASMRQQIEMAGGTWQTLGMGDHRRLDPEIAAHYTSVSEQQRLGPLSLERVRTWELLGRHLPPPPAVVPDIGGAAGSTPCPWPHRATGSTWSTRLRCTSSRPCAPRPSSRPPRWPAPASVTPGSWTGRTPVSTAPCCLVPCTTSPTGPTGSTR